TPLSVAHRSSLHSFRPSTVQCFCQPPRAHRTAYCAHATPKPHVCVDTFAVANLSSCFDKIARRKGYNQKTVIYFLYSCDNHSQKSTRRTPVTFRSRMPSSA